MTKRLAGAGADREDLRQDVWLAILQQDPSTHSSLRPWIATVARRLAGRGFGKKRARQFIESRYALDRPEADESVTRAGSGLDLDDELSGVLSQLPAVNQTILRLRYEAGMSFREVAEEIGLSENAVRLRHHRSLVEIRRLVQANSGEAESNWTERLRGLALLCLGRMRPRQQAALRGIALVSIPAIVVAILFHARPAQIDPGKQPRLKVPLDDSYGLVELESPMHTVAKRSQPNGPESNSQAQAADAAAPKSSSFQVETLLDGVPFSGARLVAYRFQPGHTIETAELAQATGVGGTAQLDDRWAGWWIGAKFSDDRASRLVFVPRNVGPEETLRLYLKTLETVSRLRVVDEAGEAIANARVSPAEPIWNSLHVRPDGYWNLAPLDAVQMTDADGRVLRRRLKSLAHRSVLVEAPGYSTICNRTDREKITLRRGLVLRGTVRDGSGSSAANARVTLRLGRTKVKQSVQTNEIGRFIFDSPPRGRIRVSAFDSSQSGSRALFFDGSKDVNIVLDKPSLQGRMRRPDGSIPQELQAYLAPPLLEEQPLFVQNQAQLFESEAVETDDDGRFFALLEDKPSTRLFAGTADGSVLLAAQGSVSSDGAIDFVVDEARSCEKVTGTVVEHGSNPNSASFVTVASDTDPFVRRARLDSEGAFEVPEPGSGNLVLEHSLLGAAFSATRRPIDGDDRSIRLQAAADVTATIRLASGAEVPLSELRVSVDDGRSLRRLLAGEARSVKGLERDTDHAVRVAIRSSHQHLVVVESKALNLKGSARFDPHSTQDLVLELERAVAIDLKLYYPPSMETGEMVTLAVENSHGDLVDRLRFYRGMHRGGNMSVEIRVPPGHYSITPEWLSGPAVPVQTFSVSKDNEGTPVDIHFR